ncbi:MAG: sigma-70 family RNA polymerase sigma factor [Actinomycetota bacterium]|nr:sigma-70 family RNA polymerase sigma factor [Actinomycetota bacterium]
MREQDQVISFEQVVLPHMAAAYNLARWLTHGDQDAEDVAQEAYLRAFRFFAGFHGGDGRVWLLAIVRNTCYTWLHQKQAQELTIPFDDDLHNVASADLGPETLLLQSADTATLKAALLELPVAFREVMILRELEDLSYKEIATVVGVPLGTVMSRLARGRGRLQASLAARRSEEA